MAYDAARQQVVLFGGGDPNPVGDTWTWDGTDWTERSPVHTPSPRWYSNMAFDPAAGRVVLFGGVVGGDYLGDTWTWNGSDWTQRTPAHSPPARWAAPTATNASGDGVVVFGGAGHPPDLLLADTWTWNGTDWTAQTAASIGLSRRSGPAGESIDVAGWGYLPGEQVKLTFSDSVIGGVKLKRVTTDASGAFHAKVRVPAGATPGKQVIRAVGNSSGDIAKQGFTVT
jgi:hypothetical protein